MDIIAQNVAIEGLYWGWCGDVYREGGAVFFLDFWRLASMNNC